ncbi:hypothetical protein DCAR_0832979 [Daucus carota subsp. sativus]|uniref:Uncharacterized protein n=1 Tax=Daucus carota subsp. sativus TaxID=79200 RepID=A0A175YRP2_DAUCS|nr:hypothetical protein DCAR_0832979 [Daucus carota subsp. sativus]
MENTSFSFLAKKLVIWIALILLIVSQVFLFQCLQSARNDRLDTVLEIARTIAIIFANILGSGLREDFAF